jgi:hypothetical protein
MSYADSLRKHFQARNAGKPLQRIKPAYSGPHRLGETGYSFFLRLDREVPGLMHCVWSPAQPDTALVQANQAAYQKAVTEFAAANLQQGVESWA